MIYCKLKPVYRPKAAGLANERYNVK